MKNSSLSNDYYSNAHPYVFDKESRIRVGLQALSVIQDFLKQKDLTKFNALEIGCSVGITANKLAPFFKTFLATDIDADAVNYANKTYKRKNLTFKVEDATNLSLKKDSFDVIICQEVYENVEEQEKLLAEILRVLKQGGICYFVGDNFLFPIETQYDIPFLHYLPNPVAKIFLKLRGYGKYYLGHYKTYWGLKKMCNKFIIKDYTMSILQNPAKYNFTRLLKYKRLIKIIPQPLLTVVFYFLPTYIFILKKP